MKQTYLKSLGLSAPKIALGTVELGLPYGFGLDGEVAQPSFEQAARLVHAALDRGVRFIDTARAYGDSEEILGRCLVDRRADVILATKVGPLHLDGQTDAAISAEIIASVEQSLRMLRTDWVDWLMIHSMSPSAVARLPRILETFDELRKQGKILAFGASIYNDTLQASLNEVGFSCLQLAASIVDRRAEDVLLDKTSADKDFIYRSVLLRGALTGRYHSLPAPMEPLRVVLAELDQLASDAGISLTELAYRYVADLDGLMLVGTADIAELDQALAFVERGSLSEDLKKAIRATPCLEDCFLNPGQWPTLETEAKNASA